MVIIKEQIIIHAEPAVIYDVLLDLDNYANWNPWIVRAQGVCELDNIVDVDAVIGQRVMTVKHRIIDLQKDKQFAWCDVGWFTALVDANRTRTIEPLESCVVQYTNQLKLFGWCEQVVKLFMGDKLRAGMRVENQALKKHVESLKSQKQSG